MIREEYERLAKKKIRDLTPVELGQLQDQRVFDIVSQEIYGESTDLFRIITKSGECEWYDRVKYSPVPADEYASLDEYEPARYWIISRALYEQFIEIGTEPVVSLLNGDLYFWLDDGTGSLYQDYYIFHDIVRYRVENNEYDSFSYATIL